MPGTIVTSGLTPGGTDTKHYKDITDLIYRFSPIRFEPGSDGPHSVNEHLPLLDYQNSINFYYLFIKNLEKDKCYLVEQLTCKNCGEKFEGT
jgi:carboxypeptidase PM20D1